MRRSACGAVVALGAAAWFWGCLGPSAREQQQAREAEAAAAAAAPAPAAALPQTLEPGQEIPLFDGTTLGAWTIEELGAHKEVSVADGAIHLGWGNPGTAIRWTGPEASLDYELRFEIQRGEGSGDAHCFVTFPVGDRACTLVLGEWAAVQCRNEAPDATEHGGIKRVALEPSRWEPVLLRVLPDRIQASIDGQPVVDLPIEPPVSPVADPRPLSIATWSMTASLRELHLKRLPVASR